MVRFCGVAVLIVATTAAQAGVEGWQDTITLPTYEEGPPDINAPFDQFLTRLPAVYPYTMRTSFGAAKATQQWRALHLKNEYLECTFLPDLGGRIYSCKDRLSGHEMFYANPAIKKQSFAIRGAFAAAGVENANFPVGHGRSTVSPVNFGLLKNADGSASVWVSDRDRVTGMQWLVQYSLRSGLAALEQKVTLYNRSSNRWPYYWWSDAAIPVYDGNSQFIFPMAVSATHGAGNLDKWPVNSAGLDMRTVSNYRDSLGLFAFGSREPFFAAFHPSIRFGVVQYANPKVVTGKKLWCWGSEGDKTVRQLLSDNGSTFMEIQAGLFETQENFEYLEPQELRQFTEYWMPARDLGGIVRADLHAVLNIERKRALIGVDRVIEVDSKRPIPKATLRLLHDGKPVWEAKADLAPERIFMHKVKGLAPDVKYVFEMLDASGSLLMRHQENTYDAVQPEKVKLGPQPSKNLGGSAAKDYLARGNNHELNGELDRAWDEYSKGAKQFSSDVPLQLALGRLAYILGNFEEAMKRLGALAAKQTDETVEAQYYLGVALARSGDDAKAIPILESLAARKEPFGAAAALEWALALARAGNAQRALEALKNARQAPGVGVAETALLRALNQRDQAMARLSSWRLLDPLDNTLRVEQTRWGAKDDDLWAHLGADPERILDVVDDYLSLGLYADALSLLERTYPAPPPNQAEPAATLPEKHALLAYYRGYCRKKLGARPTADFQAASGLSIRYVFPRRASSLAVLRMALAENAGDATAAYLLGCWYLNARMTADAIAMWQKARPSARKLPGLHRNLGRTLLDIQNKPKEALPVLQEGVAIEPDNKDLADALQRCLKALNPTPAPKSPVSETPSTPVQRAQTPPPQPSAPPPPVKAGTPLEVAQNALEYAAKGFIVEALQMFSPSVFSDERQPPPVRQAYIELQLQRLLANARQGNCAQASRMAEKLGEEQSGLPFTFYGFGEFMGRPRFRYYLALADFLCGDEKEARKQWNRLARKELPVTSIDYAFPQLAAFQMNPADPKPLEAALNQLQQALSKQPSAADRAALTYSEGMILAALGRKAEAVKRLETLGAEADPVLRYLGASAIHEVTGARARRQ